MANEITASVPIAAAADNKKRPLQREQPVDGQVFDEITIKTEPRYKQSRGSGDEWRYKARVTLKYKGRVLDETDWRDVDTTVSRLQAVTNQFREQAMDWQAERKEREPKCDQEGCDQDATVTLRIKKRHCQCCGTERSIETGYRRFCAMHSTRGDCSIEDSDCNYEIVPESVGL
jgi:hypothetical protein